MAINAYMANNEPLVAEIKTETAEEAGIRDYVYIKGDPGPAGPTGPKGDKGDTGDRGPTGPAGEKGEKGDKGDAFEYSDFTPEQLEALTGPQGPKGDDGAKGDKGDKGDTGATGATGPQGPAGVPGIVVQDDEPTDGELVWIDTDDPGTTHIIPEIDDDNVSPSDTWSSQKIRDFIYPVGSIYMSVNSTSPATIFGGTWERLKDRFLLGAGDTYTAGDTGGEATHTLTGAELPKTSGSFRIRRMSWGTSATSSASMVTSQSGIVTGIQTTGSGADSVAYYNGVTRGVDEVTLSFGSDAAHNNMPPYLAVYIWKRTA